MTTTAIPMLWQVILMIDIFSFAFMRTGLIGAIISGICCSLIGVFVVLRGMSYVGTGIAHGSLAGVALAFLMGWNPLAASAFVALAMVVIIEFLSRRTTLKVDSAIGVTFSLAMALAVLFIGLLQRYTPRNHCGPAFFQGISVFHF